MILFFKEFSWVSELTSNIDRNLFASVHAYEYAINIVRNLGDYEKKRLQLLTKRFGNVRSEMGVYWMNKCAQAVKNLDHEAAKVRSSIHSSNSFVSLSFRKSKINFERVSKVSMLLFKPSKKSMMYRISLYYIPISVV
jgi:hypothetical protein